MAKVNRRCGLANGVNNFGQALKVLARKPAGMAAAAAESHSRVVHRAARANERGSAAAVRARVRQDPEASNRRAGQTCGTAEEI
jgi:hypothetical protein